MQLASIVLGEGLSLREGILAGTADESIGACTTAEIAALHPDRRRPKSLPLDINHLCTKYRRESCRTMRIKGRLGSSLGMGILTIT
jgi:hypothetical protein